MNLYEITKVSIYWYDYETKKLMFVRRNNYTILQESVGNLEDFVQWQSDPNNNNTSVECESLEEAIAISELLLLS